MSTTNAPQKKPVAKLIKSRKPRQPHARNAITQDIPQEILDTARMASGSKHRGKSMLSRIMDMLAEDSKQRVGASRLDDAADAYVRQLELGSFQHAKEMFDRQEGKVVNRHGDAEGKSMKFYVGLPVDDEEGAP